MLSSGRLTFSRGVFSPLLFLSSKISALILNFQFAFNPFFFFFVFFTSEARLIKIVIRVPARRVSGAYREVRARVLMGMLDLEELLPFNYLCSFISLAVEGTLCLLTHSLGIV